jgi:hypothetical protein
MKRLFEIRIHKSDAHRAGIARGDGGEFYPLRLLISAAFTSAR